MRNLYADEAIWAKMEKRAGLEPLAECILELAYDDETLARAVAHSVMIDDYGYVSTTLEGKKVRAKMGANSVLGLLHTLEDYLACVSVAERSAEVGKRY